MRVCVQRTVAIKIVSVARSSPACVLNKLAVGFSCSRGLGSSMHCRTTFAGVRPPRRLRTLGAVAVCIHGCAQLPRRHSGSKSLLLKCQRSCNGHERLMPNSTLIQALRAMTPVGESIDLEGAREGGTYKTAQERFDR